MEGYIVNGTGMSFHIFKRKFPSRHKILLADIWPLYEVKVKVELAKKSVSEAEFVDWLDKRGLMKNGFEYVAGEKASMEGKVEQASPATYDAQGISADGRLERPSLDGAPQRVIDKLTYSDIAELRVVDNPKAILDKINNKSKLMRARTVVRQAGRKAFLEKHLKQRIMVLDRLS